MSRVGKKPISLPATVTVTIEDGLVRVQGPKGTLETKVHPVVHVSVEETETGKELVVTVDHDDTGVSRAQWGTARAILANFITGVTEGFTKKLEINGVGYRVRLTGRTLVLSVGYSHEVPCELPQGLDAEVDGNVIILKSADKHMLGQVAADIRRIRKPEPYKGKGIKYSDETIRRKSGKAQKSGE